MKALQSQLFWSQFVHTVPVHEHEEYVLFGVQRDGSVKKLQSQLFSMQFLHTVPVHEHAKLVLFAVQ